MAGVNTYKDKVVSRLWKGLTGLVASRHIDVIEGEGRLVSPTQVRVGDQVVEGAHVVLATGSDSRSLPGLQIDGEKVIASDHALKLDRVPASVVILGGGVIGVEFASVWRSFGAEVTIVEMLPHLLPAEEESSSKLLERAFRRRGIGYKLGTRFESVKDTDSGVTVTLEGGETIDAELVLVAVGRGPVSATKRPAYPSIAASCWLMRSVGPMCRRSRPSATSPRGCSWRMSASAREYLSEKGSRGCLSSRSTTTGAPGLPTATPRWLPWASPPRSPRSPASRSPRSPTPWPVTASARSCRPRARRRSSPPLAAARCSAFTSSARARAT